MRRRKKADSQLVLGEPKEMIGSPLKFLALSQYEAEKLCLLVCDVDKLPAHTIKFYKRRTKNTMATYDPEQLKVIIYKGYNTVHTVLHEMAHSADIQHNNKWIECFKRYINLWETRWYLYFS